MQSTIKNVVLTCVCCLYSSTTIASDFQWTGTAGRQGSYSVIDHNSRGTFHRSIRFINIRYRGVKDSRRWREAFLQAAAYCRRENVTFPAGGDGNFEQVGGLSNSNVAIFGWFDDTTGEHGYVVVTAIVGDKVAYTLSNGRSFEIGPNPSNFENWRIGGDPGDWVSTTTYASVQIWKHRGASSPNAGVCLRFRHETHGKNPYR